MATPGTNIDNPKPNKGASLRLLQRKRELRELQELLEAERDIFKLKKEELSRIESALDEKNHDLMRSKEKASRHLGQNEQKRLRAEERCAKENQLCQKLDSDLALLQQRLNEKKAEVEASRVNMLT